MSKVRKECNPDHWKAHDSNYICNLETGRWVKKDDDIGVHVRLVKGERKKKKKCKGKSSKRYAKDRQGNLIYVCNPDTGEYVKRSGVIGQRILLERKLKRKRKTKHRKEGEEEPIYEITSYEDGLRTLNELYKLTQELEEEYGKHSREYEEGVQRLTLERNQILEQMMHERLSSPSQEPSPQSVESLQDKEEQMSEFESQGKTTKKKLVAQLQDAYKQIENLEIQLVSMKQQDKFDKGPVPKELATFQQQLQKPGAMEMEMKREGYPTRALQLQPGQRPQQQQAGVGMAPQQYLAQLEQQQVNQYNNMAETQRQQYTQHINSLAQYLDQYVKYANQLQSMLQRGGLSSQQVSTIRERLQQYYGVIRQLEGQIRQQEAAYNRTVTNLHSQYQQRINQLRNQLRDAQQQVGVMRGMYSRNEQELQKKKRS